jgi:hypothetical protein
MKLSSARAALRRVAGSPASIMLCRGFSLAEAQRPFVLTLRNGKDLHSRPSPNGETQQIRISGYLADGHIVGVAAETDATVAA